jgi:hypothetical protein
MFYVVGVLILLAAAVAAAFRAEHLVLLHWDRVGSFLLEHVGGGRYEKIAFSAAPLAVARFVARRTAVGWAATRRRARTWAQAHRPHPLGAKL